MPRFFFNARRADGEVIRDREGVEYANITEARAEAERANVEVRAKLLATEPRSAIRSGTVEVADETGSVVASIKSPMVRPRAALTWKPHRSSYSPARPLRAVGNSETLRRR